MKEIFEVGLILCSVLCGSLAFATIEPTPEEIRMLREALEESATLYSDEFKEPGPCLLKYGAKFVEGETYAWVDLESYIIETSGLEVIEEGWSSFGEAFRNYGEDGVCYWTVHWLDYDLYATLPKVFCKAPYKMYGKEYRDGVLLSYSFVLGFKKGYLFLKSVDEVVEGEDVVYKSKSGIGR